VVAFEGLMARVGTHRAVVAIEAQLGLGETQIFDGFVVIRGRWPGVRRMTMVKTDGWRSIGAYLLRQNKSS
jgi:hypothetical protein